MVHTDANVAIRNYLNYYICALDHVFVALAKMGIKISLVTFKVNYPISTLRRTESGPRALAPLQDPPDDDLRQMIESAIDDINKSTEGHDTETTLGRNLLEARSS